MDMDQMLTKFSILGFVCSVPLYLPHKISNHRVSAIDGHNLLESLFCRTLKFSWSRPGLSIKSLLCRIMQINRRPAPFGLKIQIFTGLKIEPAAEVSPAILIHQNRTRDTLFKFLGTTKLLYRPNNKECCTLQRPFD
ncbi:hypothetical protein VNO77_36965 [Canavalia gladiata]|uniref:Uncharacterized protein n=1 Tax=Canavalia gladiata TaxID=3824 RepID=A0AAN9PWV5_CANGL